MAYVIYTSGSTGEPKGVMIEHCGLVNRIVWMQNKYNINSQDRVLHKTPFTFDVSVWELMLPLVCGARLVMAIPNGHSDPYYIIKTIQDYKITIVHFVPSMFKLFLQSLQKNEIKTLRHIFCSGEALSAQLVDDCFLLLPTPVHNLYGPTEASIEVSSWECKISDSSQFITSPIGKPIQNLQLYILDKYMDPVPIGVPGELYIGGIGLARGYLNRSDLTMNHFITFKDRSGKIKQDVRLYKTGDAACWLPEGNIDFIGRLDEQVKIRGFRIELGEIESKLRQHPAVKEVVITTSNDSQNNKQLVAYLVFSDKTLPISANSLRDYLKDMLPDYMIPALFVPIDTIPLTTSGKLNRKILPDPTKHRLKPSAEQIRMISRNEEIILEVWQSVLQLTDININDNFFDLGGNSLLLIQIQSKLEKILEKHVPMFELFNHPTIASLSSYFDSLTQPIKHLSSDQQYVNRRIDSLKRNRHRMKKLNLYGGEI